MNGTIIDGEVVSFDVTRPRSMDRRMPGYLAGNMGVRCAALRKCQFPHVNRPFKIAGAGKIEGQPRTRNNAVDKHVAGAGCTDLVQGRKGNISLQLIVAETGPEPSFQPDDQDAIYYLGDDSIPHFDVSRADHHLFVLAMTEV